MANDTGGVPMFLQPSEAGKAFHLVRESTRNNMGTVLWATGTIEGTDQTFEVPLDSTIKRITFTLSVNTKGTKLTLTQPSGGTISEATASTEITELNCGCIVTVSAPENGTWRAKITGSGTFWIEAKVESDINFISVEFVKEAGRIGHEGLFKIPGQPLAGIPAALEVSLSASAAKTRDFHLVTERGEKIQELRMEPVNSDPGFLELVGSLEVPKKPFRVIVTGRDSNGQSYQRFYAPLFHAESVEVLPEKVVDELPVGITTPVTFRVRNIGPSSRFKITVTDSKRLVSQTAPVELNLNTGESGIVRVDLNVPAGTGPGMEDDVVIVASSIAGPTTSNSSVLSLSISSSAQNPR